MVEFVAVAQVVGQSNGHNALLGLEIIARGTFAECDLACIEGDKVHRDLGCYIARADDIKTPIYFDPNDDFLFEDGDDF